MRPLSSAFQIMHFSHNASTWCEKAYYGSGELVAKRHLQPSNLGGGNCDHESKENSNNDGVLNRETNQAATDVFDSDDDNNGENEDDIVGNDQSIAGDIGSAPDNNPDRDFEDCSVGDDEDGTGYYIDGNPCWCPK